MKRLERTYRKEIEADKEIREFIEKRKTQIKVVGCGGAGSNAITRLMQVGIFGAETIALNTDAQHLLFANANLKILIGKELTKGFGAGKNPKIGMEAAKESKEEIKAALKGADMVFVTAGLGGGCLRGSSLIYTNPDGPVRIDSIKTGDFVYCLDNGKLEKRKVLAAMKTGIKKVFEIKTENRFLYASYDHPFLKVISINPDKRGRFNKFMLKWIPAKLLKPGDLVVVLRKIPDFGKLGKLGDEIYFSEKFCRLFGFLIGDGWLGRSKKMNRRYRRLFDEIFGMKMKKGENWYYRGSKRIYEILLNLGLNKPAREKEIPTWIFELPDSCKKEFILGLVDADGSYYRQKGKKKIELRFETESEKLIGQLKVLCDYLGLRTSNISWRTRELKPPCSKKPIKSTFWNLRIYSLFQLNKTFEKQMKRKSIEFLYGYRGPTTSEFFKNFGFDKIKSVKEVGDEEVYDITVEGSHNFIAEGFVVHNTGGGSIPIVADIAKKLGALTIAIVTWPFTVEGRRIYENAMEGLKNLEGVADTLIIIPNDKLLEIVPELSLPQAFKIADEILVNAVKGIAELVTKPGLVNLDFADVKAIMGGGGLAMIGMGESNTENRAIEAVEMALNNPLITVNVNNARGALINVVGGPDVTIKEAQQIVESVSTKLSSDAKIIWGAHIAKELRDTVRTLIIVTGVESPQIFGKPWTKEKRKDIEKILGIEFVS